MKSSVIRSAESRDIETIAEIHFSAWQSVYRGKIPDGYLDSLKLEEFRDRWISYLNKENYKILVIEVQNEVLGFICFGPSDDKGLNNTNTAEILYIYFNIFCTLLQS